MLISLLNIDSYKSTNYEISQNLYRILEMIHIKIEEKFKSYRDAFRKMNIDFNDYISFSEFWKGLESIGICLRLTDYRQVYDFIDENKNGQINYSEFCKIPQTIERPFIQVETKAK